LSAFFLFAFISLSIGCQKIVHRINFLSYQGISKYFSTKY
jgi:hypothetical protein